MVTKLRQRYNIVRNVVKGVDTAMPCHRTGYDKHNLHKHVVSNPDASKERKSERQRKKRKKRENDKIMENIYIGALWPRRVSGF